MPDLHVWGNYYIFLLNLVKDCINHLWWRAAQPQSIPSMQKLELLIPNENFPEKCVADKVIEIWNYMII